MFHLRVLIFFFLVVKRCPWKASQLEAYLARVKQTKKKAGQKEATHNFIVPGRFLAKKMLQSIQNGSQVERFHQNKKWTEGDEPERTKEIKAERKTGKEKT